MGKTTSHGEKTRGDNLNTKTKAGKVLDILGKDYPDARVTLNFHDPLQLLMATILAAQCTDERVNLVTKDLFRKYHNAADFARADLKTLEEEIRPTGFYHNKAKNMTRCCQMIIQKFQGGVPRT